MNMLQTLQRWQREGLLQPLDVHLPALLAERCTRFPDEVALAAALLTVALARGDVCVDLQHIDGHPGFAASDAPVIDAVALRHALENEPTVCSAPAQARETPLILDGHRLYLQRYYRSEARVAERILSLLGARYEPDAQVKAHLDALYPGAADGQDGQQRDACLASITRAFSIISGGPGTGKTSTVARLLVAWAEQQARYGRRPLIRLAAPTGKAAARVSESMQRQLDALLSAGQLSPERADILPREAVTLHRLLGARVGGAGFRNDKGNPLALDLLVIDECSMMDLRLCEAVLQALPGHARLIMLGDPDQLASVDAGNVFAELNALSEASSVLHHSHRFAAVPGIGALAQVINRGDVSALELLLDAPGEGIRIDRHAGALVGVALQAVVAGYAPLLEQVRAGAGASEVLALQGRFQLLCALRDGPCGVNGLNRIIEAQLAAQGWIDPTQRFYPGRPLMVTRNDHSLRLYNGDLGIVMRIDGELRAVFADGAGVRSVPVSRLPPHESAWAMTVHKSQGSEFDEVALCLPDPRAQAAANLVRRELLYTGVTRARRAVHLMLPEGPLPMGWLGATARRSGLAARLLGAC